MTTLNDGEVVITLGEREYVLRPTLNAIRTLSRQNGGMQAVFQHIVRRNFDGLVSIIKVGASVPDKDDTDLAQRVFRAGINDKLMMPLVDYLQILENGGKPLQKANPVTDEPPAEAAAGND